MRVIYFALSAQPVKGVRAVGRLYHLFQDFGYFQGLGTTMAACRHRPKYPHSRVPGLLDFPVNDIGEGRKIA